MSESGAYPPCEERHRFQAPAGVEYDGVVVTCLDCGVVAVRSWTITPWEPSASDE